ncbi:MAG: hypothetical protein JWN95_303 [Frankiales bacterium]|nr:hypothetical protein [Frankiales bacterium]
MTRTDRRSVPDACVPILERMGRRAAYLYLETGLTAVNHFQDKPGLDEFAAVYRHAWSRVIAEAGMSMRHQPVIPWV